MLWSFAIYLRNCGKRELEIAAFGLKKLPITECDSFFDNPEFDPKDRLEFFSEDEISGEEYIKKTNGLIWEFACVVQYLYRRDMLLSSNVRFNKDLSYSEDLYFMWNILPFVTRMSHTGLVPYRYVQNPNSCLNSNEKGHVRKVNDSMFKLALLFQSKRGCFIRDKALSTLLDKTIKDLILRHLVIMLRQGYPIEIVKSRLLELEKQRLFPVGYELIGSPYLPKSKKWRFCYGYPIPGGGI